MSRLTDNEARYGYGTIVLHWLVAALAIYLLWTGYQVFFLARGPERSLIQATHLSVGWGVCALIVLRIVWRLSNTYPAISDNSHWSNKVARPAHWLLLILIAGLATTGYVAATTGSGDISIWGWFDVPGLLGAFPNQRYYSEKFHELLAHSFVALLAVHVLAALKRQIIDGEGTLARMLWVRQGKNLQDAADARPRHST